MSVTQTLMGPGNLTISLAEPLPQSIRNALRCLDHVAIGPQGLADLGLSNANFLAAIKAAKGYVGVILDLPDTLTIGGQDLSWWLGDSSGIGPTADSPIVRTTSTNTSTWLDQILPTNGITKGAVTNGTSFAGVTNFFPTDIEVLNWICQQAGTEWVINADGTVDVAPSTTLFPAPTTSDATIITRDPSGDEGGLSGVEAVQMDRAANAEAVVSRAVVFHTESAADVSFITASQTPTGVRWKDFAGNTPTDRTLRADAPNLRLAAATTLATNLVTSQSVIQREVTLSSRTHNVAAEVRPGDRVWAYDPEVGLSDTANQVTWRGEVITPAQLRVASLTWPITQGVGVYLRIDGTWTDITRYVQVEENIVSWVVTSTGRRNNWTPVSYGAVEIDMPGDGGGKRTVSVGRRSGRADSSARAAWTPTWTNLTVGTGGSAANLGFFAVADGEMRMDVRAVLGTSGSSVGSGVSVALPPGWQLRQNAVGSIGVYGRARLSVAGAEQDYGFVETNGITNASLRVRTQTRATITATVPATWAAGDSLQFSVVIPVEPA
jgi:hypothetical protein